MHTHTNCHALHNYSTDATTTFGHAYENQFDFRVNHMRKV